jgi:hypothetical protein
MPLPQLIRYKNFSPEHQGTNIALLRHTGRQASIVHLIENVTKKNPIDYFQIRWTGSNEPLPILPRGSKVYPNLDPNRFMITLHEECSIAIDDAENYIGWSRFVMECAIAFIPCIGSNHANKLIFPELWTEHKDYTKQQELIEKLQNDKNFYKDIAFRGQKYVMDNLNPEFLCKYFMDTIHTLKPPETIMSQDDFLKESLMTILDRTLPFAIIPRRPNTGETVFDKASNSIVDSERWDMLYGKYEKFISNDSLYKELIRETIDKKNQRVREIQ